MNESLLAQKPNLKFRSLTQADGLINGSVQTIFEDSFGFIWLGTHQGVQRFDGKTYKNFSHTTMDSLGLSSNFVIRFCEDKEHNIWIGTLNGLNRYDRKTDKIEKYSWPDQTSTEIREAYVTMVFMDESDESILWFAAIGYGLVKLDIITKDYEVYPIKAKLGSTISWMLPFPGNDDKLLMGSTELLSFDKNSGQFEELLKLDQSAGVSNNRINDAIIDPVNKDVIWIATGDFWGRGTRGGLIGFNLKTGDKKEFSSQNRKEFIGINHLLKLSFTDDNSLWIGTRHNGVILYKKDIDKFYVYQRNIYDDNSLVTETAIRSMLFDRSGTLWLGSWGDGISVISPASQKFSHYKHLPNNPNGLPDSDVTAFAEDKDGNIWVGTQRGLSKFNPKTKSFENYSKLFVNSAGETVRITYLFIDSRNILWVGTHFNSLYRYNPQTSQLIHYEKGKSNLNVTQKRISSVSEIKTDEILITTYGGGLNIYNYSTNSFRHFINNPDDPESIADNQIWLPFQGEDGNYYFSGNSTHGLIQFNPSTEKFSHLNTINTSSYQMPTVTTSGKIYVDDAAEGLTVLTMDGGTLQVAPVYDKYGNGIKNIESILEDEDNRLWIGTGNGLLEYDPEMNSIRRYDSDDGLQGYNFHQQAAFKSSTGEMYFGGTNGFSVFHPDKVKLSNYKPSIVFTDFKLFQEPVEIGDNSPLKQNILQTNRLDLYYNQNDFSISFAALDYSNPQKIKYKYLLENHDVEWINSGYNNVANYTNMDPGEYTLKVLATNADGVWIDKDKSILISIKPPWWKTIFAYVVYGLLFIIFLFLIDRIQRRRLREKERSKNREKELIQAQEIEKAYNELKATQTQLIQAEKMASLGELTAGIAHEIQNPLNFVNNFSEINSELIDELKEEVEKGNIKEIAELANDIKDNEERINHHGKRADAIVKGMLQHSRSSEGKKESTDLNTLCNEYLRLSYHGLRAKDKSFNATMKVDFDESVGKQNVIPQDLGRVVLNLINNAFFAVDEKKKSKIDNYEPTVSVSTKKKDDKIEICVTDNGGGIPKNVLDKIFQPFFTTKASGEGTGLGLSLSYDIITKGHGGKLIVETNEGEGSVFIIQIPI